MQKASVVGILPQRGIHADADLKSDNILASLLEGGGFVEDEDGGSHFAV